jgi:2-polyprenyl-3-methyl-5-hydroxy-6-metoxy-1,4-benzoquinol methylase/ribosomal protein S27E
MRENEIRPKVFAAEQRVVMLQDVGRLLTRRAEFVEVACPACAAERRTVKFDKYGLNYRECAVCRTVYVSPRPSPAVLEWFYGGSLNYAYWNQHIFPASESARRTKIFVPRVNRFLELCGRHGVAIGSLLEVGAGFGTFCAELMSRHAFQRILAIEPTPELAAHCRSRGIQTIAKPFEEVEFGTGERFDAVVCFEVLEHLFSPEAFVRRVQSVLAENGLFVATCPNVLGFDILTLGRLSDSVDAEHLNYFHPGSLATLLARCGFEVLEVVTPGALDAELVRKKALNGEVSLDGQPWLKRILVDEWERVGGAFQAFLAENGLSSHMWACARRGAGEAARA